MYTTHQHTRIVSATPTFQRKPIGVERYDQLLDSFVVSKPNATFKTPTHTYHHHKTNSKQLSERHRCNTKAWHRWNPNISSRLFFRGGGKFQRGGDKSTHISHRCVKSTPHRPFFKAGDTEQIVAHVALSLCRATAACHACRRPGSEPFPTVALSNAPLVNDLPAFAGKKTKQGRHAMEDRKSVHGKQG